MQERFPTTQGFANLPANRLEELRALLQRNIGNLKKGSTPQAKCTVDLSIEMPLSVQGIPPETQQFIKMLKQNLHDHQEFRARVLLLAGLPRLPEAHKRSPQEIFNSKEITDCVSDLMCTRRHLDMVMDQDASAPLTGAVFRSYCLNLAKYLLNRGNAEAMIMDDYMLREVRTLHAELEQKTKQDLDRCLVIDDSMLNSFQELFYFDWRHYHHCFSMLLFKIIECNVHSILKVKSRVRDFAELRELVLATCACWSLLQIVHLQHHNILPWSEGEHILPLWVNDQIQLMITALVNPDQSLCLQYLDNTVNLLVNKLVRLQTFCPSYFADFAYLPMRKKLMSSATSSNQNAPHQPPQQQQQPQQRTRRIPSTQNHSTAPRQAQPAVTQATDDVSISSVVAGRRMSQPQPQHSPYQRPPLQPSQSSQQNPTCHQQRPVPPPPNPSSQVPIAHQQQASLAMNQQQRMRFDAELQQLGNAEMRQMHMQSPWQSQNQQYLAQQPNERMPLMPPAYNPYMQHTQMQPPPSQHTQHQQAMMQSMHMHQNHNPNMPSHLVRHLLQPQQQQQQQQQLHYTSSGRQVSSATPRQSRSHNVPSHNPLYNLDQVTRNLGRLVETPNMPPPPPAYSQMQRPVSSAFGWGGAHMAAPHQSVPYQSSRLPQNPAAATTQPPLDHNIPSQARPAQRRNQPAVRQPERRTSINSIEDYLDRPPMTPLNQPAPDQTIAPIVIQPLEPQCSGRRDSFSPRSESFMQHRSHFNVSVNSTCSRVSNSPISDAEDVKPPLPPRRRLGDIGLIDLDPEPDISSIGLAAATDSDATQPEAQDSPPQNNSTLIGNLRNLVNPTNSSDQEKLATILSQLKGSPSRMISDRSSSMSSEKGANDPERVSSVPPRRPSAPDPRPPLTSPSEVRAVPPMPNETPLVSSNRTEPERTPKKHPSQSSEDPVPSSERDEPPEKRKSPGAFSAPVFPAAPAAHMTPHIKDEDGFVTVNSPAIDSPMPASWPQSSPVVHQRTNAPEYILMEDNFDITDKAPSKLTAVSDDDEAEDLILTGQEGPKYPSIAGVTELPEDDEDIQVEILQKEHIYIDLDNDESLSDTEIEDHLPNLSPTKDKPLISRNEAIEFNKHFTKADRAIDALTQGLEASQIPNSDDTVGSSNDVQIMRDLYSNSTNTEPSPICIDSDHEGQS